MTKLTHYPEQYSTAGEKSPYGISSGCAVYKIDNNIALILLLIRDRKNIVSYHLPKGTVYVDESLEQAALRETAEEAGVKVELTAYLGADRGEFVYEEKQYDKIFHYYGAKFIKDIGSMDNEHDGKVWVSTDEAINLLEKTSPEKKESIYIKRLSMHLNSNK